MQIKEINEITGYDNVADGYQVCDTGEIWSNKSNKFLKPTPSYNNKNHTGYHVYTVNLQLKNHKSKQFLLHRIIASAFIPNPNPLLLTEVNHKDSDTSNNNVNNLEWISSNNNKSLSNHQNKHAAIKQVWRCDKDTHEHLELFTSIMDAERAGYGNHTGIVAVCKGRQKTCGGFFWEYN